ncbi:FAD-binding protein [Pontiellaceae bacterium B12219]|nr:FAD-binding protein [Pontiellaceae bacterium B12219]
MILSDDILNIKKILAQAEVSYETDIDLQKFSYFCSGGIAKLIVYPKNFDELRLFIEYMCSKKFEFKVIGDTSNLLFLDDLTYGVFLSLKYFSEIQYNAEAGVIRAQAGAGLPLLSRKALLWSITGFENFEGIPGTIGGGIFMNAGAYGPEIKDCLIKVYGIQSTGEPFELTTDEMQFAYRESFISKNSGKYIITHADFIARRGETQRIFDRMELLHAKRHKYQDFLYPTLGTLFAGTEIYSAIGRNDKKYTMMLKILERLWFSKKIRRERPMNKRKLNDFVCRYFGWNFDIKPFSDKTMNCLTNRGQHTDKFIEYIELLRAHLPETARLENEIIQDNLYVDQ